MENVAASSHLTENLLSMPICKVLTRQGRQSLLYFAIHRRVPNPRIEQVSINELRSVERFIIKPQLVPILRGLKNLQLRHANLTINRDRKRLDLYVGNQCTISLISKMSSRDLRLGRTPEEEKIICLYKIGLALNPGEVLAWTKRLKKLTSTRHKNILLRVAHGDIFSNSRLCRFGLRNEANCANCPERVETIIHRIAECPLAIDTWTKVNEAKVMLGMQPLTDFSIENLLGTTERPNKIELAINAEVLHKLASRGEGYRPDQVVRATLQLIKNSEELVPSLRSKLKEYIDSH